MRRNRIIDATSDELEQAKQTALALVQDSVSAKVTDLFFADNLTEVENGIKQLNEFSGKSWILSALLLYTMVYNKDLYRQSGMDWHEYMKQSRQRIGLDQRDVTEQLSAARFFIKNHEALQRAGWSPVGSNIKLARAELALQLSGSLQETINHIAHDTWHDFKEWYTSFKPAKKLPQATEHTRSDVEVRDGRFVIGGTDAVIISDAIPEDDRQRLKNYLRIIFESIAQGYEPAIIPVYDTKEAAQLSRLRDKYRQGK